MLVAGPGLYQCQPTKWGVASLTRKAKLWEEAPGQSGDARCMSGMAHGGGKQVRLLLGKLGNIIVVLHLLRMLDTACMQVAPVWQLQGALTASMCSGGPRQMLCT